MDLVTALAEAEKAYHALMTGKGVVSVWYNSRRTEFTPSDGPKLSRYIVELKAKIAGKPARLAPASVTFQC